MAATGERSWSSAGQTVKKFDRNPIPKGDYDLKLDAASAKVEKKPEPGKVPYIAMSFPALGTATTEGGKDRRVFKNLFLHLTTGKDGVVNATRQGGILNLAQALGEEVNFPIRTVPYQKFNKEGKPEGKMVKIDILDPEAVLAWLKSHDGAIVRGTVIVDNRRKGFDPRNEIDYFHPAEETSGEESGEEYQLEDESGDTGEELADESTEEASEEEAAAAETSEEEAAEEDEGEDLTAIMNPKLAAKRAAEAAAKKPAPAKGKAPPPKAKGKR